MPLLQVHDCPEDIYKKISLVAKKQKRTIAQQVVVLLEQSLSQEHPNKERRKKLLSKIENRQISDEIKAIDAVKLIREERDK